MFDHNIFQENLVGVDYCERMVKETNPGVLELANRTEAPHAGDHGYKTIGDIMRALNPLEGDFYREALQISRYTREMFCLMEGRARPSVHALPGRRRHGRDRAAVHRLPDPADALRRVHEALRAAARRPVRLLLHRACPGYEKVGQRRILLGCWGSLNDPEYCDFTYQNMADWGRKMFVTPGVVVDGKLVTNSLVDINLGIRILLGSSFYEDWEDKEMFVTHDPLGNPVDRRHPWNQHTIPRPAKRDFDNQYSWVMSPRWFDGKDHLALDTGGGPIARLWSTALSGLVDIGGYVKATGHSVVINLPKTMLKPAVTLRVEDPAVVQRDRAQPGPHLLPGVLRGGRAALRREGARRGARRQDEDVGEVRGAQGRRRRRLHRGGPRRAVAPHGDPRRQDRQLPPVPADAVERQRPRHVRHARARTRTRCRTRRSSRRTRRRTSRASTSCVRYAASTRACHAACTCTSATATR